MSTRIFAVSVAVTLSIAAAARPSAQSNGLGALIQKAKEKLAKPKIVALPPPATATAPSAPAPRAPAPAAATPRRPTAAETEAAIQRKNAADAQKVFDALHQTITQDVKPPTEATAEKDKNWRAQAAKANKDPQSKPYRDAHASCQAAK